jgi:RNA polymerase primary sigma factor
MENLNPDDPLAMYMRELSTIVPLTAHEETSLFQELRETIGTDRGEMIERRLIESQLPLVASIAQKHVACGIPMLELIQEGQSRVNEICKGVYQAIRRGLPHVCCHPH